jgi:hypothetical protein
MWYKFNLRTFIAIYAIISALTIALIFFVGVGSGDNFEHAPYFFHLALPFLMLLQGFTHILIKIDFFNTHDLLSVVIAWAVHSYIFMLLLNLIKDKKQPKPSQCDTNISA